MSQGRNAWKGKQAAEKDKTVAILPVKSPEVFAVNCPECGSEDTKVDNKKKWSRVRYCRCLKCDHTWKQLGPPIHTPTCPTNPAHTETDVYNVNEEQRLFFCKCSQCGETWREPMPAPESEVDAFPDIAPAPGFRDAPRAADSPPEITSPAVEKPSGADVQT